MYLKRLEISGFKSFANKVVLDFGHSSSDSGQEKMSGITAIVGPNGSGKSNIADSLRWVMGEQSMKNLRGKKSEDIIFAGSGKKARLGSAGVSLFFDNSDKRLAIDYTEVEIARKIFRNGESEYLINGARVRLQDVIDLLAKAGIGRESYSIVNQGMADAVLNATPSERRSIIEDASGVKHYQIKKERALRKLESTRENLEKTRSLVEEIKPHLRMLKRQAERAAESESIAKELREKSLRLYASSWFDFQKERQGLYEAKDAFGVDMMHLQRQTDEMTDRVNIAMKKDEKNEVLEKLEEKKRDQRNLLNELERTLIVTEGRIEIEKEKAESLAAIAEIKIHSVAVDLGYVKEKLNVIWTEYEKLTEKLSRINSLEELAMLKGEIDSVKKSLFELREDIHRGKKEALQETVKNEIIPEQTPKSFEAVRKLEEERISLKEEIIKLQEAVKNTETEIQATILKDREARQEFFELERKLRILQEELNRKKDHFNESKVALAKVEVREEDLRAQIQRELRMEPEQLETPTETIDRFNLEREVEKLKFKFEQAGGIDPMVVEEYRETNTRFEFLTKESEDLEKAIASLKEIIKEMEQKIDLVFNETFEKINAEFTRYFRIIFGGGNADLKKIELKKRIKKEESEEGEDENPNPEMAEEATKEEKAEIGVDIMACPPGKRISNLSMLSGGERSLTSLALLFAIISFNPPPFCVLDEVEAALDEANSRRFGRILQSLTEHTQFVIITHNRETMRQASAMYGVTMGEDGVSKLLSVRLDQIGQGGKIIEEK